MYISNVYFCCKVIISFKIKFLLKKSCTDVLMMCLINYLLHTIWLILKMNYKLYSVYVKWTRIGKFKFLWTFLFSSRIKINLFPTPLLFGNCTQQFSRDYSQLGTQRLLLAVMRRLYNGGEWIPGFTCKVYLKPLELGPCLHVILMTFSHQRELNIC